MTKTLLFGAKGFIGRYVVESFRQHGSQLVIAEDLGVKDITDEETTLKTIQSVRPTSIINLAGISTVTEGQLNHLFDVNAFAVNSLLESASRNGVEAFVHASSANVYGAQERKAVDESAPLKPLNHYGISKVASESYCRWYESSMRVTMTRSFNCIGRGQKPNFLVPKLLQAFKRRDSLIELGNIEISRDFVDVRDVAEVYFRLVTTDEARGAFNLASGVSTPISDLIKLLVEITGHHPEIRSNETAIRPNDLTFQQGSPAKAETALKYKNRFSLRDTLIWALEEP